MTISLDQEYGNLNLSQKYPKKKKKQIYISIQEAQAAKLTT